MRADRGFEARSPVLPPRFIASTYDNMMDYIQSLASIFNAPLFATFIVGAFWKRTTPAAGWPGLMAGRSPRSG